MIFLMCKLYGCISLCSVKWSVCMLFAVQPPKAKGGKKGGKKGKKKTAKTPVVIDGISTEEMTKEQVFFA